MELPVGIEPTTKTETLAATWYHCYKHTSVLRTNSSRQTHTTLIMDNGKVTALTLLDLSAAFDSINHTILMDLLSLWILWYCVFGVALSWFKFILVVDTRELRLWAVFHQHLIFHVVFLRVQFWDCYFLHCTQFH